MFRIPLYFLKAESDIFFNNVFQDLIQLRDDDETSFSGNLFHKRTGLFRKK